MPTSSNPVLTMLKADHKKVKAFFTEYHQATPWNQKDLAQTTLEAGGSAGTATHCKQS